MITCLLIIIIPVMLLLLKFICSCTCRRTITGQQHERVKSTTTTQSNLHKLLSVKDVIFPIQQLHMNISSENMSSISSVHIICCACVGGISDLSVHFIWKFYIVVHFIRIWGDVWIWTLCLKIWTHFSFRSHCALHLKSWLSCSLHLKPGGYNWSWTLHLKMWTHFRFGSQCALHLKSWPSCSLHLKLGGGVYLISVCTSSDKLTWLFTLSENLT